MDELFKTIGQPSREKNTQLSPLFLEDKKKLEMLEEAILDETKNVEYFENLMNGARSKDDKEIIRQIRMDEKKHIKLLTNIFWEISGETPTITPVSIPASNPLPMDYEKMIFSKLEAVEFYRRILFACPNQELRDMLYEMISDEQNHAAKFTYLYVKNIF